MDVHLTPDLEAKLDQLSAETGRAKEELVQDAMAGYLDELSQVRDTLSARYDDIKSGRTKPLDGEEVFARLRRKKSDHPLD
jgi:predicted transcriptional regulator